VASRADLRRSDFPRAGFVDEEWLFNKSDDLRFRA
jgi:hypothetical protein